MSLLQISEPGESPKKNCSTSSSKKNVVGIDLGTTHSLIAHVNHEGLPICLTDDHGDSLLASVVHYSSHHLPITGTTACEYLTSEPADTLRSIKRFMGKNSGELPNNLPYRQVNKLDSNAPVSFLVQTKEGLKSISPVDVSAEILCALKQRAEKKLGSLDGVVITVPAYFDEAQRLATKQAGLQAGLRVLRLLNEPTAAALAYGLEKQAQGTYVVYDLGGGTFDVSILDLHEGIFTVLATAGDTQLGGDDMDQALFDFIIEKHQANLPAITLPLQDASWRREVLALMKAAKHQLTQALLVNISLPQMNVTYSVSRDDFSQLILPLIERTLRRCDQALIDAGLSISSIDGIILVGGATRIPAVRQQVEAFFKKMPLHDINPDEVVALGAAIQAEIIANQREDILLIDVTPLSLGLELMGGVVEVIIPRNSRIPTLAKQAFTTYTDGQTGFSLHVVQGERDKAEHCRSLAKFHLKGIPPMKAGMARLEVTFLVDENGLLEVSAQELTSGKMTRVEIQPAYGLSTEQIEQMIEDSYLHAEEDIKNRQLAEKQIEGRQLLATVESALKEDFALLTSDEHVKVSQQLEKLRTALQTKDESLLAQVIAAVENETRAFAERRMNKVVLEKLSGKTIESVEKE